MLFEQGEFEEKDGSVVVYDEFGSIYKEPTTIPTTTPIQTHPTTTPSPTIEKPTSTPEIVVNNSKECP